MDIKSRWYLSIIFLCAFQSAVGEDEEDFVSCSRGDLKFNCTALEEDKEHIEVFKRNNFYRDKYRYCLPKDLRTYGKHGYVTFSNCRFPTVPNDLFQRLRHSSDIVLDNSNITEIGDARFPDNNELARLSMSQNNLSEVPNTLFSNTPQLRRVDFSYNQIRNIDPKTFSETKEVAGLDFAHNLIEAIDEKTFDALTKLIQIDFSFNRLETFHTKFLKSKHLSRLILSNNRIARLDCDIFFDSPEAYRREIDLSMNQLREIDLSCDKSNQSLTLYINDNHLENLTLSTSPSLRSLDASRNKIRNVFIQSEQKSLERLHLANNSLSDVSDIFKYCTSLEQLDLSFNDIEDVTAVSSPEALRIIVLIKNRIRKLGCNIFPNATWYTTMVDATMNLLTEIDLNCDKISENLILAIGAILKT